MEILVNNNGFANTIIFVHGAYHGAWCWNEKFVPFFLEKGFNTYSFSFRGHGNSEGEEKLNRYSIKNYIEDLKSVFDMCEKPPIVIVHSMGATIVDAFFKYYKPEISKIVFLAPTPVKNMLFGAFHSALLSTRQSTVDIFLDGQISEAEREKYEKLIVVQESKKVMLNVVLGLNKPVINEKIETLVMGSWSDKVVLSKDVFQRAKYYKARLIMVDGICHDMMLSNKWRIVANYILDFINENKNT